MFRQIYNWNIVACDVKQPVPTPQSKWSSEFVVLLCCVFHIVLLSYYIEFFRMDNNEK